jgi:hypothetical protein
VHAVVVALGDEVDDRLGKLPVGHVDRAARGRWRRRRGQQLAQPYLQPTDLLGRADHPGDRVGEPLVRDPGRRRRHRRAGRRQQVGRRGRGAAGQQATGQLASSARSTADLGGSRGRRACQKLIGGRSGPTLQRPTGCCPSGSHSVTEVGMTS